MAGKISKKLAKKAAIKKTAKPRKAVAKPGKSGDVKLLSGGNPQIAKAYSDAPVRAYIAAMPGWKSAVGRQLDKIITRTVPGVRKAVRWNSPLYGMEDNVWFLGVHCFNKYIKVAFFRGAALRPLPPGTSKQKDVRYLDIRENEPLDEAQFAAWVKQASQSPARKCERAGHEESDKEKRDERNESRRIAHAADRCAHQGIGRLARRSPRADPRAHQAGRPGRG